MKKLLLPLVLATSLFAQGVSSFDIGAATVNLENRTTDDMMYLGYQAMTSDDGLALGIGIDVLQYRVEWTPSIKKTKAYVLSPELIIGYTYKVFSLKAAVGVGVHRINDENYMGTSYDLAMEVKVIEWFGVGYKYKAFQSSYDAGSNRGFANILYMKASF